MSEIITYDSSRGRMMDLMKQINRTVEYKFPVGYDGPVPATDKQTVTFTRFAKPKPNGEYDYSQWAAEGDDFWREVEVPKIAGLVPDKDVIESKDLTYTDSPETVVVTYCYGDAIASNSSSADSKTNSQSLSETTESISESNDQPASESVAGSVATLEPISLSEDASSDQLSETVRSAKGFTNSNEQQETKEPVQPTTIEETQKPSQVKQAVMVQPIHFDPIVKPIPISNQYRSLLLEPIVKDAVSSMLLIGCNRFKDDMYVTELFPNG